MSVNVVQNGPTYISAHSADVILSDIRPIKLKVEALRSINVLLDEFLYCILAASRSLSTDKLRAGLLKVLPTNLGKEALLEAEVELRAYWERTKPPGGAASPQTDDVQNFHLQWSFELLRLKCEAYSTLNEHDENVVAENSLNERMLQSGGFTSPKPALVAPAALYLTAILEAMCEHILSNVGRVASRDSSRTSATVQDLFVALCEDESIYGLFKSMKVYDQIEAFSQTAKHQRTKSFSRAEKTSTSSSALPHDELPPVLTSSISRVSSDTTASPGTHGSPSTSRTSFDKPRGVKKFMSGRQSQEDSNSGHKRSESSSYSVDSKSTMVENEKFEVEDSNLLQEFDDLMRSNATMKVSLTPDRLRTMEVYKRDLKNKAAIQSVTTGAVADAPAQPAADHPSRLNGRRPSLRPVDSIVEDDEESRTSPVVLSPPPPPPPPKMSELAPPSSTRIRSASMATPNGGGERVLPRKLSHTTMPPPSSMSKASSVPSTPKQLKTPDSDGRPSRSRNLQRNRESLDLDDIMAGSDDELSTSPSALEPKAAKVASSRRAPGMPTVSASTKELIDFLAEGPPPTMPPSQSPPMMEPSKSKGGGRLQRMMSKLTMSGEKTQSKSSAASDVSTPLKSPRRVLANQSSFTNISALANRPIPPRPSQITPPESPPLYEEPHSSLSSTRSRSGTTTKKPVPPWESSEESQPLSSATSDPKDHEPVQAQGVSRASQASTRLRWDEDEGRKTNSRRSSLNVQRVPVPSIDPSLDNGTSSRGRMTPKTVPDTPELQPKRVSLSKGQNGLVNGTTTSPVQSPVPAPAPAPAPAPGLSTSDAEVLHRLMGNATNADECRLILHTMLVKSGISIDPPPHSPTALPPLAARVTDHNPMLESLLVELFLGNESWIPAETVVEGDTEGSDPVPEETKPEAAIENGVRSPSPVNKGVGNGHAAPAPSGPQPVAAAA